MVPLNQLRPLMGLASMMGIVSATRPNTDHSPWSVRDMGQGMTVALLLTRSHWQRHTARLSDTVITRLQLL